MSDYDLGTAHGEIKLDSDTSGVEIAKASLDRFNDAVKKLSSAAATFQASADKIDAALNEMRRNYDETDRSVNKLDRDVSGMNSTLGVHVQATRKASSANKEFEGSISSLQTEYEGLNRAMDVYLPRLKQAIAFGKSIKGMDESDSTLKKLAVSFVRVGGASTALELLKSRVLGVNKAMESAPSWQRSIVKMAGTVGTVSAVVKVLTNWEGMASKVALVSQDAGLKMLQFGMAFSKAAPPILNAVGWVKRFNEQIDGVSRGAFKTIGGLALMRSGFEGLNRSFGIFGKDFKSGSFYLDLFLKAVKFVFLPGIILSSAALQSFGKLLQWTSNLVAGLWDGIKQLSGGLLALPGLFATIGAAVGTGVVIFGTLKSAFKELGSAKGDIDKINAAIAAMPPYLRPLGQAIVDLTPKWKDFQNTITNTFVTGAADQLKVLANQMLPKIASGSIQVSNSFRLAKDDLLNFITSGKSITAMLTIFGNTAQIITTISSNIGMLGGGLRDLAVVGSGFIRDLAQDYLPGIAIGFNNWAKAAVDSGKALQWMKNSVAAVHDLFRGTIDLTKALYGLLTTFKSTDGGNNFLAKYAKDMDDFNKKVQASLQGGLLRRIGDDIRSWGTNKIHDLVEMFKSLEPAIKAAYGILKQMSGAFSNLLPLLELALTTIGGLIQAFNAIGGGYIVGTILTISTAFGWITKALLPLWNILKIVLGAFAFKSGAETVILGIAGALENLGGIGAKASGALLGAGDAIAGFATKVAGAVAIAVSAFMAYEAGQHFISDTNTIISDSSKQAATDVQKLKDAFADDKGIAGAHVFDAETKSIDNMMAKTKDLAAKAPGIMEHIGDFLAGGHEQDRLSWNPFEALGESDAFNNAQKITEDAKAAKEAFEALGMSSKSLTDQITGATPGFDSTIQKLEDMGHNGSLAAEQLLEEKKSFDLVSAAARDAGPNALMFAKAVNEIANAGGNAQTKLDGLKSALTALGLFKEDEYQAALNLAKAIDDIGNAAAGVVDKTQPLANILDPNTGMLNPQAGANAANIYNAVKQISESFLALSTSNPGEAASFIPKMMDQLDNLRQQFGLDKDAFDKFIASMGIDPKIVTILLQLNGADQAKQDIIQTVALMQMHVGNGVKIPVSIGDPARAAALSNQINGMFGGKPATTADNGNLFISPGANQAEIDAIAKKYGINLSGVGPPPGLPSPNSQVPQGPMPAPVAPAAAPPPLTDEQKKDAKEAAKPPAPEHLSPGMPQPVQPPRTAKGASVEPAVPAVGPDPAPTPPTPPPGVPLTLSSGQVPGQAPAAQTPETPLSIAPSGADQLANAQKQVNDAAGTIMKAWADMQASIQKGFGDSLNAINTFVQQANQRLTTAANQAKLAGISFGTSFAAGIRSPASLKAINDAAAKAAQTAKDYMPRSPAKMGPLSGDGWSGIAGKAFSDDFAGGISGGVSNISSSAKEAAAAAHIVFAGLTKGVPDDKNFLKQFTDLTTLAGNIQKAFTGMFSTGTQLIQALADPFKTGGFFGKALGYERDKKVTDADLAEKRQKGDEGVGGDLLGGADSLAGVIAPGKEDIAAAIIGEGTKRGYDRNTQIAALSAVMKEDPNFNPQQMEVGGSDHKGLFQMDSGYKDRGTAQGQIKDFYDRLDQLGGPGATKADPLDFIATQFEKGGYGGADLGKHSVAAAELYNQVLGKAGSVGVGPDSAFQGADGIGSNPASRAKDTAGHYDVEQGAQAIGLPGLYATSGPNAYKLPQWMNDLASKFGLTASTYSTGGSLHQMGFAADFQGDPKMMEAFAAYVQANLKGQTLQLIHQGQSGQKYGIASGEDVGPGTSQPNYYAGNWGEEGTMVHWATDVAPIIGAGVAGAQSSQNDQILQALRGNNQSLDQAIKIGQNPTSTDAQVADSLQQIKQASIEQNKGNTPESKQNAKALDSLASSLSSSRGMTEAKDPISSASGVISGASQIAGDVIGDINDTIEAIGATKNSADILVRGIANTQDVMKLIDNTQKWISTVAQYAQTVGDVANEVGQVANAASEGEPGGGSVAGIAGIIGGVASAISGGLQGLNEVIDLAQEVYQIWGSYYGNFLGFLSGGGNSLKGDVQYLLDQNTNQLLAYSTDNPMLKAAHQLPGQVQNPAANNQAIGQLNYYAGPGTDARQATRDMMFQVKAAGYAGAVAS